MICGCGQFCRADARRACDRSAFERVSPAPFVAARSAAKLAPIPLRVATVDHCVQLALGDEPPDAAPRSAPRSVYVVGSVPQGRRSSEQELVIGIPRMCRSSVTAARRSGARWMPGATRPGSLADHRDIDLARQLGQQSPKLRRRAVADDRGSTTCEDSRRARAPLRSAEPVRRDTRPDTGAECAPAVRRCRWRHGPRQRRSAVHG